MFDNILVHQKNFILSLVNDDKFDQALAHLEFVKELWVACDYTYKYREIRQRIINRVRQLWAESQHHKTATKWYNLLQKLLGENNGLAA